MAATPTATSSGGEGSYRCRLPCGHGYNNNTDLSVLWCGLKNHAWRTHGTPTPIGYPPCYHTRGLATSGEYHAVSPLVLHHVGQVDNMGHHPAGYTIAMAGIPAVALL